MKLISCHVENFGRLHAFDMDFTDGLNVIRQDNGWGKSTLAGFIKAMFYGLDGDRKRAAAESERKKYKPWQGGTFGGRLLFEAGEKRYLVSRTFGDTAAKDTFDLRDGMSNLPSADYSADLGKELFRIDSASFYRTVFFGQSGFIAGSTDDIHAKISNLSDNTDDLNNFQSADKLLGAQISRLTPDRATGSLRRRKDELAELRRKVLEGQDLDARIARKENELKEAEREKEAEAKRRAELEEIQRKAIQAQQALFLRSERKRLEEAKKDAASALAEAESWFPSDIPPEEELTVMRRTADEMEKSRGLTEAYELPADSREELAALEKVFGDLPPTQQELDDYFRKERLYRDVRHRYEKTRLSPSEQEDFDALTAEFSGEGAETDSALLMWEERCRKAGALHSKRATLTALIAEAKSEQAVRMRWALFPVVMGGFLLVLGLLLLPVSRITGAIAAAAGGILAAVGGVLYLRKKEALAREPETEEAKALKFEIDRDETFIGEADGFLSRFLEAHGYSFEPSRVSLMLGTVSGKKQTFDRLAQRREQAEWIYHESRLAEKEDFFCDYLRKYGFRVTDKGEESFYEGLYELAAKAGKYRGLLSRQSRFAAAESDYRGAKEQIHAFFERYGLPEGDDPKAAVSSVVKSVEEFRARRLALFKATLKLIDFDAENPEIPSEDTDGELPPLDEITGEINATNSTTEALGEAVTRLSGELTALNEQYDRWEEDCAKLDEATAVQQEEQRRYDRLVKAREHLRLAKERMTSRYTDPITRSFGQYYEMLTGASAEAFRVDAEANVTAEEYGAQRDVSLLSTGYRDLTGICLRLALADAMYPDEKPPLILDDPFAFLDDGKLAASKAFLQAVGEKYQIIYFTCASSRK